VYGDGGGFFLLPGEDVPWHALGPEEVASRLGTDPQHGLPVPKAARRLRALGPNELPESRGSGFLRLVAAQFRSALVAVLLLAVAVSLLLGNAKEAVAIGAVEFEELRRARAGAVP
jgi:magnesium-transporting ATPase (P-type)